MFRPILFLLFAAFALPASATPPTVSITAPDDGATWDNTPSLRVSADAVDLNGPVTLVEFYLNDQKAGSTNTLQTGTLGTFVTYLTTRPAAGPYLLTAIAYNGAAESTVSSAVNLTIAVPPPAPTVVTGAATPGAVDAVIHGTVGPGTCRRGA